MIVDLGQLSAIGCTKWQSDKEYKKGQMVIEDSDLYTALVANRGHNPSDESGRTYWEKNTNLKELMDRAQETVTAAEGVNRAIEEANTARDEAKDAARYAIEYIDGDAKSKIDDAEAATASANNAANTALSEAEKANDATVNANRAAADANRAYNVVTAYHDITTIPDHTRAEQDHTRAEQDHARHVEDHQEAVRQRAAEANEFNRTQQEKQAIFDEKEAQRDIAVEEATKVSNKVDRNTAVLGPYADRAPIVLTLEENGKAINRAGVKVNKTGWAICSFIGQKGDVYSFDPGVMDNDVCIFSEEIVKKEYRPIEYKYSYDAEGLPTNAVATYNGAVHSYTFTYVKDAEGHVTSETITDDQTGEVLNALPYQYQSVIGTYHPLTILNASAELPLDHHCRLISHFQGEGTIRVTVSFNVASANMNLLVFRDGLIVNLATQLGTIFQMISETNKALSLLETHVKSLDSAVTNIVHTAVDDSALPTLCGQPPILFGAGTPQEAIVPDNWKQFDTETGEGYNWNGEPSAAGQQYINTSASTGGRYIAVPSADGGLTWKNF